MPEPAALLDPDELQRRVDAVLSVPLHRFLGLELADPAEPSAGVAFTVAEPSQSPGGTLHGGVVCALLDVASYLALMPSFAPDEHAVTHDLTASLIRAVPAGSRVELTGSVVRRGRSIAFLRAEARVDGEVVASGQVTKTILRTGR